jgi:uncharacterized membrane protein YeaQ/YmgE (transglycosylase-associated protein family)
MLKSELMAASGPSSSQTPSSPVGNPSAAALTTALENALNFVLTRPLAFYEKCRCAAGRVVKQWLDGRRNGGMKRYVIFALVGPFLGGFLLLIATTVLSGYWNETNIAEVKKIFVVLFSTLQYTYLFGILPALAIAAIDDIICHINRVSAALRMLIVGVIAFAAAELLYGNRGSDSGALQFILYGLVGLVPAMLSSWLAQDKKAA